MNRVTKIVAPVMALALLLAWSFVARAEDKAATGTVSVTVTDKDGKAAEGVTVRITAPKQAAGKNAQLLADDTKPAEKTKTEPVATAKTDKDGKATLENVPAGSYNLSANLKSVGGARQKIEVKAGETLSVELKLAPRASAAQK